MSTLALTVNGKELSADVEPRTHLADFLRETLHLTGTHLGCEHGVCGACTLMVDGVPVRSCITLAIACSGSEITTIEGQDSDEVMRALRNAFSREHALQCGFCTPGMLASARDVVLRMPDASAQEIRIAMSGNLCRCTGYVGIIRAIQSVLSERKLNENVSDTFKVERPLGPVGSRLGTEPVESRTNVAAISRTPTSTNQLIQPSSSTVDSFDDFKPQTTLKQSFLVRQPRSDVWALFANLDEVTACLPGASLKEPSKDGRLQLTMRVKVGPMAADFDGVAHAVQGTSTYTGIIYGSGQDARSRSATRGKIRYRVVEEPESRATRVDVELGFTITGPFAQVSRSGILNDVAKRMCASFAQNVELRLRNRHDGVRTDQIDAPAERLDAGSLVLSVLWERVKAFFRSLLR